MQPDAPAPTKRVYLNVDQVAELVTLSRRTVLRAIAAGELEASRLTRKRGGWRIRAAAVENWMDRRSNLRGKRRAPAPERASVVRPASSAAERARRGRAPVKLSVGPGDGRR